MPRQFLRVQELAERYDVSVSQVWRLVSLGALPEPIKLSARCTRWPVADLDFWDKINYRSKTILELERLDLDNNS